ncbi:MAG TPA: DUF4105 domain-containing protein [Deltaproteobacteria bacterium]|nr:DUF4105 domain-containing protein [Deltaproteobacteria bacterium]HPP80926.1 DUF4105 domain-containing protein [Deltaproteobacteria bacterium]
MLWHLCVFCCVSSPVGASDYASVAVERAKALRLHEHPYWHVLLHYESGLFGLRSLVDDDRFFLAPDGKTNPESELEATIRAFFRAPGQGETPAVCRFVARYEWLRRMLDLDTGRLPVPSCTDFMAFLEQMRPKSATLAFPMAHLNSPASMYGHTLVTVQTANESALLSYSVSYSALTSETFGPAFALKSIFGFYPGYFSVLPYYRKLQEYNDVDHRDIWEYRLDLTEEETRRMILHVRELQDIHSDYYFFDENCSYSLMYLLDAARDGERLTGKVRGWMIPLDSIRMIERAGMIEGVSYRPSRVTRIRYFLGRMTDAEREMAYSLATSDGDTHHDEGLTTGRGALVLEAAGEYLQYLYTKGAVSRDDYRRRYLKILTARSALGPQEDEERGEPAPGADPLKGHLSNRFSLGAGARTGDPFVEFRVRPAYHALMDDDTGYVEGAHLVFADVILRSYPGEDRFVLQAIDAIDIVSLCPRDRFFRPISWKVKAGLTRVPDSNGADRLVFGVNPGAGWAFGETAGLLCYGMVETAAYVGGVLEKDCLFGAGASAGVLKTFPTPLKWKVHLFTRGLTLGPWDRHNHFEAGLSQGLTLGKDESLGIDLAFERERGFPQWESKVSWNVFF